MKKKVLSVFLAVLMIFSVLPVSVFAEEADSIEGGNAELAIELKQTLQIQTKNLEEKAVFNAYLTKDAQSEKHLKDITLVRQADDMTHTATISAIKAGKYCLHIDGQRHVPYTQVIEIKDGKRASITIYNDDAANIDPKNPSFGVIPFGDVNNDEVINDLDAQEIAQAISDQKKPDANTFYDVNNDGEVNLIDLAYVVRNNTANKESACVLAPVTYTTSSIALAANAAAKIAENTKPAKVGNLSAEDLKEPDKVADAIRDTLLGVAAAKEATPEDAKDNFVQLEGKGEEALSPDNPVELDLALVDTDAQGKPLAEAQAPTEAEAITIVPPVNADSKITSGALTVTGRAEGEEEDGTFTVPFGEQPAAAAAYASRSIAAYAPKEGNRTNIESNGTVVVDLGKKVAIKKVTIRITGNSKNNNLAEIAKVEFFDNFADRIGEPQLSIPTIDEEAIKCTSGEHKSLTVSWDKQENVSGYELSINGPGVNVVRYSEENTYTFVSDDFVGNIKGFADYKLKVRSVSGEWRSDWSTEVVHHVTPTELPPATEYVKATPGITSLTISWRDMWDVEKYYVYYREASDEPANSTEWIEKDAGNKTSYLLDGLIGGKEYDVRVKTWNSNGDGPMSTIVRGMAQTAQAVEMPKMDLLNTISESGRYDTGIASIKGSEINDFYTVYDEANPEGKEYPGKSYDLTKAMTDGKPETNIKIPDWDQGYVYANFRAPVIFLNEPTEIDTIRLGASEVAGTVHINSAKFEWYNHTKEGSEAKGTVNCSVAQKFDAQGRRYYELVAEEPIIADEIQVRTSTGYGNPQRITEVRVYKYNSLLDDVDKLFTNELQVELVPGVTHQTIQDLRDRANKRDEATGEYHYAKEIILKTLEFADQLVDDSGKLEPEIKIDPSISLRQDGHLDFAQQLSDLQPLGYVASTGDTIVIYVGSKTEARGATSSLELYITQYHPQVSNWITSLGKLKVGKNEITIPKIDSSSEKEHGGSLYVAETANANSKQYSVRVSFAKKIPKLEVKGVEDAERLPLIKAYVKELNAYVKDLANNHNIYNEQRTLDKVNKYDVTNCVLNSTEIGMNYMFYSLPADQVLQGIKNITKAWSGEQFENDQDKQAEALAASIKGMEEQVTLFYQMRGLNAVNPSNSTDRFPLCRLNIRYHQMFTGAFMYAGGKHIGIEYGSVADVFGTQVSTTDNGIRKPGTNYNGWGICHEIGHCINSTKYQRVEVTNNVFAQLAQTDETNATFRAATYIGPKDAIEAGGKEQYQTAVDNPDNYTYDKVYKAVATGKTGHTGDLAVQLAYFWQIHLAYDQNNRSFKLYDTVKDQQDNLIYSKIDSFMRNPALAKIDVKENEEAIKDKIETLELKLDSDADNNFMRAVCRAAKKNLLDFFRAWGFTPNSETVAYVEAGKKYDNWTDEERLIQYIDDNARLNAITNKENLENIKMNPQTKAIVKFTSDDDSFEGYDAVNKSKNRISGNSVTLEISVPEGNKANVHGFEIRRDGKVIGFVTAKNGEATYTDVLSTENNKAFEYSVIPVDEALLASKAEPEVFEIKIQNDGKLDTSNWTGESSTYGVEDQKDQPRDPDAMTHEANSYLSTVSNAFDGKPDTAFNAVPGTLVFSEENGAEQESIPGFPFSIKLNLGEVQQLSAIGLMISNPDDLESYMISVSADDDNYDVVKYGTLNDKDIRSSGAYKVAYFNKMIDEQTMDPFMYTYDAKFVVINFTPKKEAQKISIQEIAIYGPTGDNVEIQENGVGHLTDDYHYLELGAEGYDKAVFKATNVIFTGSFQGDPAYNVVLLKDQKGNYINGSQIIFAEVPEEGPLGKTSDGTWVYEVDPNDLTQAQEMKDGQAVGDPYTVETVKVELYRVMDAMNMTGQRLTSTSMTLYDVQSKLSQTVEIKKDAPAAGVSESAPAAATAPISMNLAPYAMNVESLGARKIVTRAAEPAVDPALPNIDVDVSKPVVLNVTGDRLDTDTFTFSLNSSTRIMGMSANIQIEGKEYNLSKQEFDTVRPTVSISWDDAVNDTTTFRAYTYDKNDGVLRLYIVARDGDLNNVNDGRAASYGGTILMEDIPDAIIKHSELPEQGPEVDTFSANSITATVKHYARVDNTYHRDSFADWGNGYSMTNILKNQGVVHNLTWRSVSPATCITPEKFEYKCADCDKVADTAPDDMTNVQVQMDEQGVKHYYLYAEEPLGHDYQEDKEQYKAPTCTVKGEKVEVCSRCKDVRKIDVEPTGHKWENDWVVTKHATCVEEGTRERTCHNGCGEKQTMTIPVSIDHVDKDNDKKCDICGKDLSDSYDNFRCKMCDKYEMNKDKPVIGWFYSLVHFFIHYFAWFKHIIKK